MVSDDRGQVLLVGAVVLAITLVAIVTLLNGVAYTEHVGGEQDAYGDAERVEQSIVRDLDGMIASIEADTDATDANLRSNTDALDERYTQMMGASRAATVDVEYLEDESTTTITHDSGAARDFIPDNTPTPPPSWTVAPSSSNELEAFTMNLQASQVPPGYGNRFVVDIDGWELGMWEQGGDVHFEWTGGGSCSVPATGTVDVDIVGGDIGGPAECTGFTGPSTPTPAIQFETEGSTVYPRGSYTIVLGELVDLHSRPEYDGSHDPTVAGNSPHVSHSAAFRVNYETPSITYENIVHVEVNDS